MSIKFIKVLSGLCLGLTILLALGVVGAVEHNVATAETWVCSLFILPFAILGVVGMHWAYGEKEGNLHG